MTGFEFFAMMLAIAPVEQQGVNIAQMSVGYTFFNREGATIDDHDASLVKCAIEASTLTSFASDVGYGGGIIGGLLNSGPQRGVMGAAVENCMVVGGWRVVRVSDTRGAALWALPETDLRATLAPMIGAAAPEGDVIRIWSNEASNAANKRFEIGPDFVQNGSLSARALGQGQAVTLPSTDSLSDEVAAKLIKPKKLAQLPPGSTLLIVGLKGLTLRTGSGVMFRRQAVDRYVRPSSTDGLPDVAIAKVGTLFAKAEGNVQVFAIAPGNWRVDALVRPPTLSFCFGSPSFEVEAGEVVYAGMFDLAAESIGPDLNVERLQILLADAKLPSPIRQARYVNGSLGACTGNGAYAIEFESPR